jgi:hypothetical protein
MELISITAGPFMVLQPVNRITQLANTAIVGAPQ